MGKRPNQAFEEYKRQTELDDGCLETDILAVDLLGNIHRQSVPTDRILETGEQFHVLCEDAALVTVPSETPSELMLVPDWSTAFRDPFLKKTAAVFCKIIDPTMHRHWPHDSRNIARKAERHLRRARIATESRWGVELQFFLTRKRGKDEGMLDSQRLRAIRTRIAATLEKVGVKVIRHREVSGGVCEFVLGHEPLLIACDKLTLAKYVIGRTSDRAGATAAFLPTIAGSKDRAMMHVHFSLWRGATPLFYDEASPSQFSSLAARVMGGILLEEPALSILCAPNFVAKHGQEVMPILEMRNPHDLGDKNARRVEVRFPDPSANPHLAFAALLLASITNKNLPEPGKPLPLHTWTGWHRVPTAPDAQAGQAEPPKPGEVMGALVESSKFLTASGVFDPKTLHAFVNIHCKSDSP